MIGIMAAYPAYGRTYATPQAAAADFVQGKDFSASPQGGPYFSIRDFQPGGNLEHFSGIFIAGYIIDLDGDVVAKAAMGDEITRH